MTRIRKLLKGLIVPSIILSATLVAPFYSANAAEEAKSANEEGKKLAFDRKKGNCLACHQIAGGDMAGTIAPPLIAMKARFPDKAVLRAQIWDATVKNPATSMPPFGRHQVLSEKEIDLVTEYIYSL